MQIYIVSHKFLQILNYFRQITWWYFFNSLICVKENGVVLFYIAETDDYFSFKKFQIFS